MAEAQLDPHKIFSNNCERACGKPVPQLLEPQEVVLVTQKMNAVKVQDEQVIIGDEDRNGDGHNKEESKIGVHGNESPSLYSFYPVNEYLDPMEDIKFEEISLGPNALRIGYYCNSENFLVVNHDKQNLVDDFTSQMSAWYNSHKDELEVILSVAHSGIYCFFDKETDKWFRIQLDMSRDIGDGRMVGILCDFGTLRAVQIEDLRYLKRIYAEFPRQAFCAELDSSDMNSSELRRMTLEEGTAYQVNIERILPTDAAVIPLLTIKLGKFIEEKVVIKETDDWDF